jgi:hypothetical protein
VLRRSVPEFREMPQGRRAVARPAESSPRLATLRGNPPRKLPFQHSGEWYPDRFTVPACGWNPK